ncbi:hypothetical protein QG053_00465 [Kingella kingae]|nr:hypothetical protein [Kingella kingae]MDK4563539.1 hypothetical protein [Kingella kingae]MDK4578150.1 hypothetical protein [Kingella kingae]MDK4608401.1 hypothetical protein [Kingella kingae]MDK4625715.1 hypothetical protein [Kingella kingae]MDK4673575.1 hypothetical protein [Kingella kingae]
MNEFNENLTVEDLNTETLGFLFIDVCGKTIKTRALKGAVNQKFD